MAATSSRAEVQEWWQALGSRDRRRDDRLRHGHRQGGRALRLPLQPAEEPGGYARRSAAPGATASPRSCELFACPDDVARRSRTSPTATRPTARRSRGSSHEVLRRRGTSFDLAEYELSDAARHAAARAPHGAHLPRARRRACAGDAVLRRLPGASRSPTSTTVCALARRARGAFLARRPRLREEGASGSTLDPEAAAGDLGQDRARIVRALDWLASEGTSSCDRRTCATATAILAPSGRPGRARRGARGAVRGARGGGDRAASGMPLAARDARRLPARTRSSATSASSAPRRAATARSASTAARLPLPAPAPVEPLPAGVDEAEIATLVSAHRARSATARQQARFLCGITSPATSKAGSASIRYSARLSDQRFADVLAWRERASLSRAG